MSPQGLSRSKLGAAIITPVFLLLLVCALSVPTQSQFVGKEFVTNLTGNFSYWLVERILRSQDNITALFYFGKSRSVGRRTSVYINIDAVYLTSRNFSESSPNMASSSKNFP